MSVAKQQPLFIGSYTDFISPEFGGYGQGISSAILNSDSGEIKVLHIEHALNPSYLCINMERRILYAVSETLKENSPQLLAYRINNDYSLSFQSMLPIDGGCPCHLNHINGSVLIACYETGNVIRFTCDDEGVPRTKVENYQHNGHSINPKRQLGPHAHQIAIHPNGHDVYVCDLGIDIIKAYQLSSSALQENPKFDIVGMKGGGVRHMVFNQDGSRAYALNELSADVCALTTNELNKTFTMTETRSSLPSNFEGVPSGSAIRLHPNQQYLYTANRGSETIAIFDVSHGKLNFISHQSTGGNELREFNISPDGNHLIACHQNSHDLVVYRIQANGKLIETYRTKELRSPVCIAFAPKLDKAILKNNATSEKKGVA